MYNTDYNKILEKAKIIYKDSVAGRDKQLELFNNGDFESHRMSIDDITFRREMYQAEINLLEQLFTKKELL